MTLLSAFHLKMFLLILEITFVWPKSQLFHNYLSAQSRHDNHITQESRNTLLIPDERKCIIFGQIGWKCTGCDSKGECCIQRKWICDGHRQCLNDNSDEIEGCALFEGPSKIAGLNSEI